MGDQEHPLLSHEAEDDLWDAVEEGGGSARTITVKDLVSTRPSEVIHTLQRKSIRKVAEFMVEDKLVLGRLGDDSILTMGSDTATLDDPERAWLEYLGAHAHRRRAQQAHGSQKGSKKGDRGWESKIPVLAYTLWVENATAPDKDGLLQPLLRRWQADGCDMDVFALPAVQAVIDWKWETYCQSILIGEWLLFMLWLVSFAVFTILFQDEDTSLSFADLLKSNRGRATVAMDILSLIAMTPFLAIEVATIHAYGFRGWFNAWNLLDLLTYALQIYIAVVHMGRVELKAGSLSVAAAVQCILLLFRMQYFSRVFKSTRFSFVDDIQEVLSDVKYYLVFILLVCCGWGLSLHILFRQEQKAHKEFSTYPMTLLTMVAWLDGNVELEKLTDSTNPLAASLLGVGFIFVMGVILMNMLIGILTASLEKVTSNEGLRMLVSKAEIVDEIDSTLPRFVEREFPQLYPKYLHILRVDPDKIDRVEKAAIWEEKPDDIRESGDNQQNGNPSKDTGDLSRKVDALQREIAELKQLIQSLKK